MGKYKIDPSPFSSIYKIPLIFGIVLPSLILFIGKRFVKDKEKFSGTCLNFAVAVLIASYPGTSKKIFATLICDNDFVQDNVGYLEADYTYRCDDPEYLFWYNYSIIMMVIFPIGIPVALTCLLFWLYYSSKMFQKDSNGKTIIHDGIPIPHTRAAKIFGSLFLGTDEKCFWFESYDMMRKLVLTSILGLIFADLNTQITMALLFVLFNFCVTALVNPYTHPTTYLLSFATCLSLTLMLIFGLAHNFSEINEQLAKSTGDVTKIALVKKDLSTSTWQTLIFIANWFGYGCCFFELLTHPYHALEHHASLLKIKHNTVVQKHHIGLYFCGCLNKKKYPNAYAAIHHDRIIASNIINSSGSGSTKALPALPNGSGSGSTKVLPALPNDDATPKEGNTSVPPIDNSIRNWNGSKEIKMLDKT